MKVFNNKIILITGGTGTFGKNFLLYLLEKSKCKKIIIFSRDEFKQYNLKEEIPSKYYGKVRFFLGDVRDSQRMLRVTKNVDFLVHAAAIKQVPASEYNPSEAIKTNIEGAQNVIEACLENKVKNIIALSTDKAVNPINLYGATKLVSDKLFIAANNLSNSKLSKFSVVRYGNVINSRGSVVPFFKELSKSKKKIPITDKKMTRFWISTTEAVQFVCNSFHLMKGGEIFIPKLPSIKITDLAKAIAPNNKIEFIGLRPGEKITEVLCGPDSQHEILEFKNYFVQTPSFNFIDANKNYQISKNFEKAKKVDLDFVYDSSTNPVILNVNQIKTLILKS
jgi:UDP-N-acetylglucosamine 4,6-dehydratase